MRRICSTVVIPCFGLITSDLVRCSTKSLTFIEQNRYSSNYKASSVLLIFNLVSINYLSWINWKQFSIYINLPQSINVNKKYSILYCFIICMLILFESWFYKRFVSVKYYLLKCWVIKLMETFIKYVIYCYIVWR